ncbi:MAG: cytochrome c [Gemmatimonadetes bacterium]|nr:cytochrome c [Gemmatimonadota bacterium]
MKWLKRFGLMIGSLVGLVVLFVAVAWAAVALRMRKTYEVPAHPLAAARDASPERGRHLALAVTKCMHCHGDDLGGKVVEDDPVFARLVASNLTRGRGGVVADYEGEDWERAVRHAVRRDGRPLVFMPAEAFWHLADEDLADVVAYVRSVPPVDRELPVTRAGPMARVITLLGAFPLLPAEMVDHARHPAPPPERRVDVAYGEYLATVGGCRGCHGPALAGNGAPGSPDITRGRLASWTQADFVRALRAGVRPDGSAISPEMP